MVVCAFLTGEASTFHADSPLKAAHRLANVMGTDVRVLPDQAYQMIADAVDGLVQIGIRNEVRRVVEIVRVQKELKVGEVGFEVVFRYCEGLACQRVALGACWLGEPFKVCPYPRVGTHAAPIIRAVI